MSVRTAQRWLATFLPAPLNVARREAVLGCVGAFVGVSGAAWLSQRVLGGFDPWFIAPMGASAVLLFAVPASPLAQPWALVGGNVCAALIGVTCVACVHDVALAAGLAVALAIAAMFALRCLHPPSGAVALTAVLGGPAVKALGYQFVLWPVAIDSLLLLALALLFNAAARRHYPHRAPPARRRVEPAPARAELTVDDLEAALRAHRELLDIGEDDLEALFLEAAALAARRRQAAP